MTETDARYVLAFDTANEVVAIGLGLLDAEARGVACVASCERAARRASNTLLLSCIDELLVREGVGREQIACVACGRGPGSFTGVRIAMATAKGMAQALPGCSAATAGAPSAAGAGAAVGAGAGATAGAAGAGECAGVAGADAEGTAHGVPLIGVSSLDAVAWNAWAAGVRGSLAVVADAMRHEVYPVRFEVNDAGAVRLQADSVMKAEAAAAGFGSVHSGAAPATGAAAATEDTASAGGTLSDAMGSAGAADSRGAVDSAGSAGAAGPANAVASGLQFAGDALAKYADLFAPCGELLPSELWTPTGRGLLLALQAAWRAGEADPFDGHRHNPAFALPVYTRLSDAEENERVRLASTQPKNLRTGVGTASDAQPGGSAGFGFEFRPLDRAHIPQVAAVERELMGSNAWSETLLAVDMRQRDRTWWMCLGAVGGDGSPSAPSASRGGSASPELLGYAGGMIADGDLQILKVVVVPQARRRGIAKALLARVAEDARNLGASTVSLEVRAGNAGAQALYRVLGMEALGTRPRYYRDGEDALIMAGALDGLVAHGVAGMDLEDHAGDAARPAAVGAGTGAGTETGAAATAASPARQAGAVAARSAAWSAAEQAAAAATAATGSGAEEPASPSASDVRHVIVRPLILAIESSCDETAAAIVDGTGRLLADVVASQIDFHARFGGVVPEIASRKHIEAICGVCDECFEVASARLAAQLAWDAAAAECAETAEAAGAPAFDTFASTLPAVLAGVSSFGDSEGGTFVPASGNCPDEAGAPAPAVPAGASSFSASAPGIAPTSAVPAPAPRLTWSDLDAVAVTYAPGLVGALVVGVAFAKGAAWGAGLPFIGVNHLEGHLYANKLSAGFAPPAVVSLVSGGNTMLVHMRDWGSYETLGTTIDDAVGEAFDKVAKALGLGYPGGPVISRLAEQGRADAIAFPRAMLHSGDLRFSLSGLKTAVVTYIAQEREAGRELNLPDIAASFQQAVIDVQVAKAKTALQQTGARTFCLGGGVAANPALRAAYEELCRRMGVQLVMPPLASCGDNAGMIALVALDRYRAGAFFGLDADAHAHASLDDPY